MQVVSISLAGAAFGSLSGTVLADSLGRLRAFLVDAVPLLAGAALCATATSPAALLSGRFLCGFGIGLASALVPLYISEVAPTSIRGICGSANQLMICLGILNALIVNVVLPVDAWRTMFWLAVVPSLLLVAGTLCSPRRPKHTTLSVEPHVHLTPDETQLPAQPVSYTHLTLPTKRIV